MDKWIVVDSEVELTRVAVLEDGELAEYYLEREGREKMAGNIYKGRVQNVLPGMQAAFVDIGAERNAFLYVGDITIDRRDFLFGGDAAEAERKFSSQSIRQVARVGQELLVQVVKEPEGAKGPRVTTHITLPGRLAVLVPTVDYVGVSRRIQDDAERARLKEEAERVKPQGMGLIVRTAAQGLSGEDFLPDIDYLTKLWESICKQGQRVSAPRLLRHDEAILTRTVRDLFTANVNRLIVGSQEDYQQVLSLVEAVSPGLADRVERYTGAVPVFDAFGIESKADKALSRKVWLKNGGYLVFDQTEALNVIDVNTGKFVGRRDLQDTVFTLNLEAAREIARQVRLRDLGGIIIIDFIDMESAEHQAQVVEALREALKQGRNKTNVVGLTGLGLVEMTRKKTRQKLSSSLQRTCPVCGGTGRVLQEEQVARRALRQVRRLRASGESGPWRVEAGPRVAGALRALRKGADVYLKECPRLGEDFQVEAVSQAEAQTLEHLI